MEHPLHFLVPEEAATSLFSAFCHLKEKDKKKVKFSCAFCWAVKFKCSKVYFKYTLTEMVVTIVS